MEPLDPRRDPARIGDFTLLKRLGSGGMGRVYLGRRADGQRAAVKVVHEHLLDSHPSFRTRFRREMEAIGRVGGFWTPPMLGSDADARRPWYATAYVDAPTLHDVVCGEGVLDLSGSVALGRSLAKALTVVHAVDLVHRDLKPSNVLMASDRPRVIDFGIALDLDGGPRLTRTGTAFGTIGYLSPEQMHGRPATPASDVFALGALLVFATSRHLPFPGETEAAVDRRMDTPPDLTGVPGPLHSVVRWCLAVDPGMRPSAAELRTVFDGIAPTPSLDGAAAATPPEVPRPTRVETAPELARGAVEGMPSGAPEQKDAGPVPPGRPPAAPLDQAGRGVGPVERPKVPGGQDDGGTIVGAAALAGGVTGAQLYWVAGLPWWGAAVLGFIVFGATVVLMDLAASATDDFLGGAVIVPALLGTGLAGVVSWQRTTYPWWAVGIMAIGWGLVVFLLLAGFVGIVGESRDEPVVAAAGAIAIVSTLLLGSLLIWVVDVAVWQSALLSAIAFLVFAPLLSRIAGGTGRRVQR